MATVSMTELKANIGKEIGISDWVKIDQDMINKFANLTRDHQFIHTDPVRAKETPFGGTIAHGFLSLSFLSHFAESIDLTLEGVKMGINYGFDRVRFMTPVSVDGDIRARIKLLDVQEKGVGRLLMKHEYTIEIKGNERPALKAEWLSMLMI
ncbi:MaoC family dehydratase [Temperatibacter marinus]|uniref:MaoC family dehydratase n=1 Tax=Temperatibacter marinus TaxID=1456591 RepID=A0AA52EE24_9PROT|nr:MaoC family dehydratase [Temperatibacter marinus]WND03015.1 MaoC family dehydratase [Temperatibacter marinus]